MYDLFAHVMEVFLMLFQGYCLQRFYGAFLKTRWFPHPAGRYQIMAVWCVMKLAMSLWWRSDYASTVTQEKNLIAIAVLIAATQFLYEGSRGMKLFLAVSFLAIEESCMILAAMTLELGGPMIELINWCFGQGIITSTDTFSLLLYAIVIGLQSLTCAGFALLLQFMLKKIVRQYREKEYPVRRTEMLFLLAPGAVSLLTCLLLRMLMIAMEGNIPRTLYDRYPRMFIMVPAILILNLSAIVYGIKLFQDMIALQREKSSRIVLEKQMRSMEENIREMDRVYEGLRGMRHDMKNQLAVIRQLMGETACGEGRAGQELENYLSSLNQTINRLELRFSTGNSVADAILNMKYHEALQAAPDIQFEAEGLLIPDNLQIRNYDIGIILCNALDNAIEACARLKGGETPRLQISSLVRGKMFFIEISNSFDGRLRRNRQGEFPETDKEDKEIHGIGLLNIKRAVEKYQGAVDWTVSQTDGGSGHIFVLTVMMKNVPPPAAQTVQRERRQ